MANVPQLETHMHSIQGLYLESQQNINVLYLEETNFSMQIDWAHCKLQKFLASHRSPQQAIASNTIYKLKSVTKTGGTLMNVKGQMSGHSIDKGTDPKKGYCLTSFSRGRSRYASWY